MEALNFLNKPTISGTSINDFRVELSKPGDEAYIVCDVTNVGSIPAVVDSGIWNEPTFTSSTNNQDDIDLVLSNFNFQAMLFYLNDGGMPTYPLFEGAVLCPGQTVQLQVGIRYSPEATSLPTSKITISDLNYDINFVAGELNLCDGSTPVEGEV